MSKATKKGRAVPNKGTRQSDYTIDAMLALLADFAIAGNKLARYLLRRLIVKDDAAIFRIYLFPSGYSDAAQFAADYQVVSLLKKFPGLDLAIDREAVAIKAFWDSEDTCRLASARIYQPAPARDIKLRGLLQAARAHCHAILGGGFRSSSDLAPFSWDEALVYCNFGPGASVGVKRQFAHKWYKVGHKEPTVTPACLPLLKALKAWDPQMWGRITHDPCVVPGSRMTTVPKDARKDRLIAIEPLFNMFFQKGIGGVIRQRLRSIGINLDRQQPINQALAREGSVTGRLATVDLSAASDSVSMALADYMLPEDYFRALLITRSPCTVPPRGDHHVVLNKISSMGNGWTFELESLIFLCLTLAVYPSATINRDVAVFGDDIIAPVSASKTLYELLQYCGFTVNAEKSFVSGPFRESCGKHFFNGRDVTPLYIRKNVSCITELMVCANNMRRAASRMASGLYCDGRFRDAYDFLVGMLPSRISKLSIPDGYGDEGIVRDFDECHPVPRCAGNFVEGYEVKMFGRLALSMRAEGDECLILKLHDPSGTQILGGFSVSKKHRGDGVVINIHDQSFNQLDVSTGRFRYVIHSAVVTQWSTLGPWE